MSKRAERKTPTKLLGNYSNIQQQFHRIFRVLYHLSVSKRIRDRVPRLLTSPQAMWLLDLRERPKQNSRRNGRDDQAFSRGSQAIPARLRLWDMKSNLLLSFFKISLETSPVLRDSTAFENSSLVTNMVTANGNKIPIVEESNEHFLQSPCQREVLKAVALVRRHRQTIQSLGAPKRNAPLLKGSGTYGLPLSSQDAIRAADSSSLGNSLSSLTSLNTLGALGFLKRTFGWSANLRS